ncbi:hypothetical protein [Mucilaginibacter psychrotolerans]|uniref:Uncharacterized protein n=1 Tax=Mucilaginibacter psychrotolerans TaxID=1524096 RepID=A0A4Y8SFQ6_9SPHI|nr:hypothetical protein [Mucilaginibacter psychrotolerans]TFF37226.1 hypothetical protein E2R66_12355 [Mucilaginibacter psychrotolerans]
MEKKKSISFTLGIVAVILGVVLFKHFDFKNLRFQQPALDIVYLITFIISIYILGRSSRGK